MSAAFEQGTAMPQKSFFAIALILSSMLLNGCDMIPEDPPLLATCDTLEYAAQQAWRTS
ncbi:hypothetical protein [Pseudomonas sp. RT6P73]